MPKDFVIIDTDYLPGGIPLDPIEVLIEDVPKAALGNVVDTALKQLCAKAKQIKANVIYAIQREDSLNEEYQNAVYNVKYTAKTCRMVIRDHIPTIW